MEVDLGESKRYCQSKEDRRQFVRGVYAILSIMLLVISLMAAVALHVPEINSDRPLNGFLVCSTLACFLGLYLFILDCESSRREPPINYVMLVLFTSTLGMFLASTAAYFAAPEVFFVTSGCFCIAFHVTLYATFCCFDVTRKYLYAWTLFPIMLIGCALITYFYIFNPSGPKLLQALLVILLVLIFTVYVINDVHMILLDPRYAAVSPNEYIFGALSLCTDVVNPCRRLIYFCCVHECRVLEDTSKCKRQVPSKYTTTVAVQD